MQSTSDAPSLAETLKNHAISLAKRGFQVFPLEIDGSTPAFEGWQQKATSDLECVESLWSSPSGDCVPYNIGVRTGHGLTVLDVDTKKGRGGGGSLEILLMLGLNDETFTVRTKSGGKHLYFDSGSTLLRNSVGHLAPGLDVRSEGGYVVGPGSTVGAQAYSIENDLPVAPIDDWFAKRCGEARAKGETSTPLVELDTPDAIARATDWLRNEAPLVVADSGNGDMTAYKVACHVKDFGLSEHECLSLILEVFDETKAHPPQGQEVWERKVENAYRHGLSAPGVKSPMADFEVETLEMLGSDPSKPKRARHIFIKGHESKALVASFADDFLVDDLLERHAVSCLYGPSNVGKTFIMLDLALHIASGRPWNGHETKKGAVVYVAAEGTRGIHKRIASWEKHHGLDLSDVWFSSRPSPIDLLSDDGDTKSFIAAVIEECSAWGEGVAPALIVIDTLSRALAGGDENSSVDMGAFVKHIDAIKTATGAHIAIVHHSGKDAAKGMRGWSGMRAAIDTEMEVQNNVLSTTKQRDGEKLEDQDFVLTDVVLGEDRRGKAIKSAVALYGAAVEMAEPEPLTADQARWAEKLEEGVAAIALESGEPISSCKFNWQTAALIWGAREASRQTIEKRLRGLQAKMVVENLKANQWVMFATPCN